MDGDLQYKLMASIDEIEIEEMQHKKQIKEMPGKVPIPQHVIDFANDLTEWSKTLKNKTYND